MSRLCQIVAVVGSKKQAALAALTSCYHQIQKANLFSGLVRSYRPKDEDGEQLPPESTVLQAKVSGMIDSVRGPLTAAWDCVATQDEANTQAKISVLPGMPAVPVTYLLFLEKQLTDLHTFIGKLPVLDPSEAWSYDSGSDCYVSTSETARTKKVPKAFEASPATDKHPAQVQIFNEDILVGYWKSTKQSGSIPLAERNAMLERCGEIKEAVVKAREEANSITVTDVNVAKLILDKIFGI